MFGKKKYDISVIVPIYNIYEDYIRECLDSLANQTKASIEVVMVDDGSTNNSGEVADEYAAKYDNFVCYHIKNGGVGHARNYGIKKARGKYLGFTDPDDIVEPDVFEKLYRAAERNKSDMAICYSIRFNSTRRFTPNPQRYAFKNLRPVSHISKNPELLYDATIWNKLVKKSYCKKYRIKIEEKHIYEDIPSSFMFHYFANSVSVIWGIGYNWRIREEGDKSISQGVDTIKNLKERLAILKILDEIFGKKVKEKRLHFEKDFRILTFDLIIFINACLELDRSDAEEMMRTMKDYVSAMSKRKAFGLLNEVERAVYQAILDEDFEQFIKLADFRKNRLLKLPFFEEEQRIFAKLPEGVLDVETVDLTEKIKRSVPRFCIDDVKTSDDEATVKTSLYIPKISIADKTEQKVRMQLVNEMTGETTPLKVHPFKNSKLTASKGKWKCKETGEEGRYNYDGTGYRFNIPISVLTPENVGNYVITAKYKNRFTKGTAAITDLSEYVKGR